MRKYVVLSLVVAGTLIQPASIGLSQSAKKANLLYMTLTTGYRHQTVDLSKEIVKEIGDKSGVFETTVTDDVAAFAKNNLKNYDVIMFNTTGELPMTDQQQKD